MIKNKGTARNIQYAGDQQYGINKYYIAQAWVI